MSMRTRKPPTTELQIERDLCRLISNRGGLAEKFTSPSRRNVPDRLCRMLGGDAFFVECKAPGAKPTKAQLRDHAQRRSVGYRVYVTDSYEYNAVIVLREVWPKDAACA